MTVRTQSPSGDSELVSTTSSRTIPKCFKLRNRFVVHRDPRNIPARVPPPDIYPLSEEDVTALLKQASTILERYRYLFKAATKSGVMDGLGDYRKLVGILNDHFGK